MSQYCVIANIAIFEIQDSKRNQKLVQYLKFKKEFDFKKSNILLKSVEPRKRQNFHAVNY